MFLNFSKKRFKNSSCAFSVVCCALLWFICELLLGIIARVVVFALTSMLYVFVFGIIVGFYDQKRGTLAFLGMNLGFCLIYEAES